jgi:hypothetical protein
VAALALAAVSLPLQALAAPAATAPCEQILAIAQQRPQLAQAYPGLHQAVVALGPSPAAFSGGGQIAVTALALRQTVTIDPTAMGGSAPLVR